MSRPVAILPVHHAQPAQRRQAVDVSCAAFGADVPEWAVRQFLELTVLPPSKRWTFLSSGKAASTSTLRFLYELEYGHALTASFTPLHDINPSALVHQLANHGVFGRALNLGLSLPALKSLPAERLLVVRNPYARAASAFRYLCRSNELGASWFLETRVRLEARTAFDWNTMPGSLDGFIRFLDFIEAEVADYGPFTLNSHWCIQARFGHPEKYEPTLVGRVEAMDTFYTILCDRLSSPMPASVLHDNRQDKPHITDALTTDPAARRRIERVYAEDFEVFGY